MHAERQAEPLKVWRFGILIVIVRVGAPGFFSRHSDPLPSPATYLAAMPHRHIAVYPGSFDPITFGHLDVIERARKLFDELIVGVGRNPGKMPLFLQEERVSLSRTLVQQLVKAEPKHSPVRVEAFDGLTVDFAREQNATVLIRGVRNLSDLQYEVQQALTNREVAGLETVFVVAGPSFAYTSSSLIRQIAALGDDMNKLSNMCPPEVVEALKEKKRQKHPLLERLNAGAGD